MLRNKLIPSTNMRFIHKVLEFEKNHELTGQDSCHIGEWSLIGYPQPGNKVYVFKEKNGKLLQTGETIQYGSLVKIDSIKIFNYYFYKNKIIYDKELFALLDWKSNQHMDFKKNNRYVRVHFGIRDIKETNNLLHDINSNYYIIQK